MIIAHVLSSFELGGQERVALDLARAQRQAGHRSIAVSLARGAEGPLGAEFRRAGVEAFTVAKYARLDPGLPFRLAALLRQECVDVVHTHNPAALVYGASAGRLARAAVLHTKHGMNPDAPRRRALRRAAAALVGAYVAVTPSLASAARRRHECKDTRLFVIENGIDLSRFAPNESKRRELRAALGVGESARVVGSVGRLSPEKNQALLIAAVEPLLGDETCLLIAGGGPEQAELRARIERSPKRDCIRLLGVRDDVPELLAAFDIFVLSSKSEGLPLVLLEAMATALPVVATRVGGIGDLVESGKSGVIVDSGDMVALREAIATLLADPDWARELGACGRSVVLARHSVSRMAREYQALYETILGGRRLARAGILGGEAV